LAAILVADVVGYTALIAADEAGTLARLRALFREAVQPSVAEHGGRVFRLLGDAVLAEFPSAVEALRCAIAVQEATAARAAPKPPGTAPIALRIGVALGDVAVEGGDLFGDGVNVAARLQAQAEPGGILVSAAVAEQAAGRVACALEDAGPLALKNMPRPVPAFRARAGAALAVLSTPPVPGPPSLVVLPFANLSGDAAEDYFADGITEELTTALARVRWFHVVDRNAAFAFRGEHVDARRAGRELGVRYALAGSVRRAGGRLRIAGQLVDAGTAGTSGSTGSKAPPRTFSRCRTR
jgi:adenylate cyclase